MFDPKVEGISTSQSYNIQFSRPFWICISLMVIEKIYLLFDFLPPLFYGADKVYHSFAGVFSIIAQLSASIAAAIIFYYCLEFINKKKDMKKYADLRRTLLIMMYFFMEIFENFDGFECIKLSKTGKRMHDSNDVEPFYSCLLQTSQNEKKDLVVEQMKAFIADKNNNFVGSLRAFRSNVEELKRLTSEYRYIRNSEENINDIENMFREADDTFSIYNNPEYINEIDINQSLTDIAEYFYDFVELITDYEVAISTFIKAINRKEIFTFMRLLD